MANLNTNPKLTSGAAGSAVIRVYLKQRAAQAVSDRLGCLTCSSGLDVRYEQLRRTAQRPREQGPRSVHG